LTIRFRPRIFPSMNTQQLISATSILAKRLWLVKLPLRRGIPFVN
jgi:hypothetical protein